MRHLGTGAAHTTFRIFAGRYRSGIARIVNDRSGRRRRICGLIRARAISAPGAVADER